MSRLPLLCLALLACGEKEPTPDSGDSQPVATDADGDGHVALEDGGDDCDDDDAGVNPSAEEACGGGDEDCDGQVDEGAAVGASDWYPDADADGYGDAAGLVSACAAPEGHVAQAEDCDDGDPEVRPGAEEGCDGVDEDCDGRVDEAVDGAPTWYEDGDGDGYGYAQTTVEACEAPSGYVADRWDCDDGDGRVHPNADEVCGDLTDNDCDGLLDECGPQGDLDLSDAWLKITGSFEDDSFGDSVAGADVNGDGDVDLIVGAPYVDDDDYNAGATYVFYGPFSGGELEAADADLRLSSADDSARFGDVVAVVGDVDGDGQQDFVVGSPGYDFADEYGTPYEDYFNSGALYLFYSPTRTSDDDLGWRNALPWHGYGRGEGHVYGSSVAPMGDVEGDGYDDFLVGAPGDEADAGAAYLYYGPLYSYDRWDYADAFATVFGDAEGDEAGYAVAGGDLDGDGFSDMLVGAPGASSGAGSVTIWLGPTAGEHVLADADVHLGGAASGDEAGSGLAAGDLDGDGYADALIGAPYADNDGDASGSVYLVLGQAAPASLGLASAAARLDGEAASDYAGFALSLPGDVDGDGATELLVGVSGNDRAGSSAGAAYLRYGPLSSGTSSLGDLDAVFEGEAAGDRAGWSVGGVDLNGDRLTDLLIGAREESTGATDAGAIYVWLGDER
ncbi:MAG: FG-GAP repeat protein [Alphaproteobacteria bacterium]|nr:FG-GAP repeat protein [Alphaproteobacteria bacterium]